MAERTREARGSRVFAGLARRAGGGLGRVLLAGALLASLAAGFLVPRLPVQTSREGMIDPDLPVQARYLEFTREFGTQNQLVVLLEGEPAAARAAAAELAAALAARPDLVKNVFHRIDLAPFRRAGLHYLPGPLLARAAALAGRRSPAVEQALAEGSLAGLVEAATAGARRARAGPLPDLPQAMLAAGLAADFLGRWQDFLTAPQAPAGLDFEPQGLAELAGLAGIEAPEIDADGTLAAAGGRLRLLFVQPARDLDDADFILPFMDFARRSAAEALAGRPGVQVGFTGWPVSIEEELSLIRRDLARVTVVAVVAVLALLALVFRSLARMLLVFVPLVFGLLWNFGLTVFTVGHLNYLTAAFAGILFGMGIDYGVVIVRRWDEERAGGRPPGEALEAALAAVGPGVLAGGLAVAASFLVIGLTDQPAFSELGIVAGTGILCVLASTFLVLVPALALLPAPPMLRGRRPPEAGLLARLAGRLLARPGLPAALLAAATAGLLALIPRVGFDYDLNRLLPADSETVRVAERLEAETPFKVQYISVIAGDLDEERRLAGRLKVLPSVARVESISRLLPAPDPARPARLAALAAALGPLAVGRPARPSDPAAVAAALADLQQQVETAQEDAFEAGLGALVAALEPVAGGLGEVRAALSAPGAAARQARFEEELLTFLAEGRTRLAEMLAAPAPDLAGLDPVLRERFTGASGRLAIFVFPRRPIWEPAALDEFLAEVNAAVEAELGPGTAEARVTGFGVVYDETTAMIRRGFVQASWMAGAVVLLVLAVSLRRPTAVLLAALPLACAAAAVLGGLGLAGRNLNLASQISLPIMLGTAVDYGLLMVRRWREPDGADLRRVVGSMGGSIGLAGATTAIGFGALTAARHRGLTSFGSLLAVAVIVAMLAAQFGIPLLIRALRLDRRPGAAAGRSRPEGSP